MSKKGFISRYLLIIKRLKRHPHSSYEELKSYIESQAEYLKMTDDTLSIAFSLRTLQRDISEIRNLFGVLIAYSKSSKGYYIHDGEKENMNFQGMMESFDLFSSFKLMTDVSPYIFLEKNRPRGAENLSDLVSAIKNRLEVDFIYQKFAWNEVSRRTVAPYVLREFRNRWYLFGCDSKDNLLKCFALDRIKAIETTKREFIRDDTFNWEHFFQYSFGIMALKDAQPEEVILAFESFQGQYIKSLPLHESQKIISETKDELRVKLEVYITHDFVMELLSFGSRVKVLHPGSLAEALKKEYRTALRNYDV